MTFFKKRKKQVSSNLNENQSKYINNIETTEEFETTEDDTLSGFETTKEQNLTTTEVNKTIQKDVKRRTPLFQPTAYSTIKPIADELIEHKVVLVDFSKLSDQDRKRSIDFLSGIMYGLKGEYTKVENKIYKFIVRD